MSSSSREVFLAAARECLRVGKRGVSAAQSSDLAAAVRAVDLGLKPALLYDGNAAGAEQVHRYLTSLRSARLVSESLLTLDVGGNAIVVNPVIVIPNLERLLHGNDGVIIIDVSRSLEKPRVVAAADPGSLGGLRNMARDLLHLLTEFQQRRPPEADGPLCVGEEVSNGWNLCTLFGVVLGYPAAYWFDQTGSFENCLAMTPLALTRASATWRAEDDDEDGGGGGGHAAVPSCLFSFSVPDVLSAETRPALEEWHRRLRHRFQQQSVFSHLTVSRSLVTLPAVCL